MKSMLRSLTVLLGASATRTDDNGQFHIHKPKEGVKDYKTGGPL